VHAAVSRTEIQESFQFFTRGSQQNLLALGIEHSHAPKMASEMSFEHEICKHCLLERGGVPFHARSGGNESLGEIERCNDICHA
jgi:hypothetical protein